MKVFLFSYVFPMICSLESGDCQLYPAVKFQSDGVPSTESFVVFNTSLPRITKFSLCVHAYLFHARGSDIPLLSYAVGNFSDEISLTFDLITGSFSLICCRGNGRFKSRGMKSLESILVWLHICIVINLEVAEITIYLNDAVQKDIIQRLNDEKLETLPGGIIVLGQEQDIVLGGFTLFQSFEGIFARYTLSDTILEENTIKSFLLCGNLPMNNPLVSFETIETKWYPRGATDITQVSSETVCSTNKYYVIVFPEQRSFDGAFQVCRILKGEVMVPEDKEGNEFLVNVTKNFIDICSSEYGVYMWLGIRAESINGSLVMMDDARGKPIKYSNFRPGFSNLFGEYKCIFMDKHLIGLWVVYPCELNSCVTCRFNSTIQLRMRGLCASSLIDKLYILNDYHNNKPKFEGIRYSKIVWSNDTWVISNSNDDSLSAIMKITESDQYPIGLRTWKIVGDVCTDTNPKLLFTSCNALQYTCNDGTCIPKIQRCDLQVQCPDRSDEVLCSPVVVPEKYIKEVPPPKVGLEPAKVSLLVTIISLYPIKVLESSVSMEILVTLKWRDPRLSLVSLNYAEDMNLISNGNEIWVPSYVIEDSSGSDTKSVLNWQTFVVVMESGPQKDDITRVEEDEAYLGSQNSLKITQAYSVEFFCKMNLASYPFDTQFCSILIRLKDVGRNFVIFKTMDMGVIYNGSKILREYEVLGAFIENKDKGNFSAYEITLKLDNLSGFYVFSTYIPTLLMVIICYSTLFFHLDDFNDRIMVSLTALLVLATLFTQITQTTPSTAYLKLLDVWFVSCIFINFIIVMLLVAINYIRIKEEENDSGFTRVLSYKKGFLPKDQVSRAKKFNHMAIIAVPLGIGIFATAYIIISLTFVI